METQSFPLYLIILLPFLGSVLSLLLGNRLGKGFVSLVACGSVLGAAQTPAGPKGKICPTCGDRFDGQATFCGKDGTALVLVN